MYKLHGKNQSGFSYTTKKEELANMKKIDDETIDVLLATYNTKIEYLKEQIDSILNQTYKNIHLIISDDNSPNEQVPEILKEYQKQDERITLYIQEKNLGYNRNFEFLLKKSQAKYIMFSDHDDIWYPEKVEKTLKKLKENDVDMVYCNCHQINENGEIIKSNYFKYKNVPLINGKSKIALSRCIGIGCSQMITKKVRDKMLPFTDQVIAHDWLASFIANELKGMTYIEEPLFGYRLHNSNVFGGRSLSQNLSKWKEENGTDYKAYLKYRNKKVIDIAYLYGAIMEKQYSILEENKKYIEELINYYENLKKSKYINFHIFKYFKLLTGKNLLKKEIKELVIFHFPIIGFLKYK